MVIPDRKVSLIALILLMQAFLLRAKSLRAVEGSQFAGEQIEHFVQAEKRTTGSSCSPSSTQLEVYFQLYGASGTDSVSNFNGNTLNYSLKAEQIRRESNTMTTEDSDLITKYDNLTRFTPAGMDLANKVVCARFLQELDEVANSISNTALCGWHYHCDYKANRLPNYLFKARCNSHNCKGNCSQGNGHHTGCLSHSVNIAVLEMEGNCGEWKWCTEPFPIACTCANI